MRSSFFDYDNELIMTKPLGLWRYSLGGSENKKK